MDHIEILRNRDPVEVSFALAATVGERGLEVSPGSAAPSVNCTSSSGAGTPPRCKQRPSGGIQPSRPARARAAAIVSPADRSPRQGPPLVLFIPPHNYRRATPQKQRQAAPRGRDCTVRLSSSESDSAARLNSPESNSAALNQAQLLGLKLRSGKSDSAAQSQTQQHRVRLRSTTEQPRVRLSTTESDFAAQSQTQQHKDSDSAALSRSWRLGAVFSNLHPRTAVHASFAGAYIQTQELRVSIGC